MAQFFKAKAKPKRTLSKLTVQGLDHHLHGVVKHQGSTYFVPDVLSGECIDIVVEQGNQGRVQRVHEKSAQRITPPCAYYQRCGGCSAQHLCAGDQQTSKAQAVRDLFMRIGGFEQLPEAEIISEHDWAYRRTARLSSLYSKAGWRIGFRAKGSKDIVTIDNCMVLEKALSDLLPSLQTLCAAWPKSLALGHLELLLVDNGPWLVLRYTGMLSNKVEQSLLAWAQYHRVSVYLHGEQARYLNTQSMPYYRLEQGLNLSLMPGDFIQVNRKLNQALVNKALSLLKLSAQDTVLDLYAGVGNFTLPMAKLARKVIAVEGIERMAKQIEANARANGIENVMAFAGDLEQLTTAQYWQGEQITRVLLDPARAGAKQAIHHICQLKVPTVVYVSCNPASLARDARVLREHGYRIAYFALADMFPQTEHIETLVAFEHEG